MKLRLLAVGTRMPDWVNKGFEQYQKRLPRQCPLELIEIPIASRKQGGTLQQLMAQEAQRINKSLANNDFIVTLDVGGKSFSTEKLAQHLENWQLAARDVSFIIGGPDGIAPDILAKADMSWSLSALTLPHPMVRILLAEQLYRAWSINNNHPYHRE